MPKITFIEHDGQEHCVDAEVGQSVMQTAMNNMIAGIIAALPGHYPAGFTTPPPLAGLRSAVFLFPERPAPPRPV